MIFESIKAKVKKTNMITRVKIVRGDIYEDEVGRQYSASELDFDVPFTEFSEKEWGKMRYETAQKTAICLLGMRRDLEYHTIIETAVNFADKLIKELRKE